jgi:hypothetical protein
MEKEILSKTRLYELLARLESSHKDCISLYIQPSSFPDRINGLSLQPQYKTYAHEIKESVNIKAVAQAVERYNTGTAIYWQKDGNKYIVLPPFPITEDKISTDEFDAAPLLETLERAYVIGVVVVTWGTYSIGVFHHDNLVKSKKGTGYIHKEHRKGEEVKKDLPAGLKNRRKLS